MVDSQNKKVKKNVFVLNFVKDNNNYIYYNNYNYYNYYNNYDCIHIFMFSDKVGKHLCAYGDYLRISRLTRTTKSTVMVRSGLHKKTKPTERFFYFFN